MKTIFVAKVYEDLTHSLNNSGRNVGWCETFAECERMIQNFGDECRWNFAVIEESSPGMHGMTRGAWWFKYDTAWIEIPGNEYRNDFMRCVNHTIG